MTRPQSGQASTPARPSKASKQAGGLNLITRLSIFGLIGLLASIGAQMLVG